MCNGRWMRPQQVLKKYVLKLTNVLQSLILSGNSATPLASETLPTNLGNSL